MRVLILLVSVLFFASCQSPSDPATEQLGPPDKGQGYVVFRVVGPGMSSRSVMTFQQDFRLHYRSSSSGPIRSILSSSRLGDFVDVSGGDGPKFVLLELDGGGYTFHSIVTSMQEKRINLTFSSTPGELTYIGDVQVDLRTRLSQGMGLTQIESAEVFCIDRTGNMEKELARRFPAGHPPLKKRLATPSMR